MSTLAAHCSSPSRLRRGRVAAAGALLLATLSSAAHGADVTSRWTGADSATNTNWSNAKNWVGNVAPTPATSSVQLEFPAGVSSFAPKDDLATPNTFFTMILTGTGYTLSGTGAALSGPRSVLNTGADNSWAASLPIRVGANRLAISSQTGGSLAMGAAIDTAGQGLDLNSPLLVTSANGPTTSDGGGRIVLTGKISDSVGGASVSILGGVVRFAQTADNTFAGVTRVTGGGTLELAVPASDAHILTGSLEIGDDASAGIVRQLTDDSFGDPADVTVTSTGLFDLTDRRAAIGHLALRSGTSSGARVAAGSGHLALVFGPTLEVTGIGAVGASIAGNLDLTVGAFAGVPLEFTVAKGAGAVDLDVSAVIHGDLRRPVSKAGPGTLRLSGANPYTGGTTIADGTLLVNGSIGDVALQGGVLGGSGSIGALNATGGTIAPGDGLGVLHTGNIIANASTTFDFELAGATAGTQYDQLTVTGTVDLGGAALALNVSTAPPAGTQLTLIANDGAEAVIGTFAGLPEGSVVTLGSAPFVITYKGGDGNDVVLRAVAVTEVPTLSSFSLLLLATILVGAALWWIEQRRDRH